MDRYQIAERPNGPWLELQVTNNPLHAAQQAWASFPDWDHIYIAKMRPIEGKDLMPEPEMLLGDIAERLITKYGSSVVSILTDEMDIYDLHRELCKAATGSLLDADVDVMVPDIVKRYSKHEQPSLADFVKPKPKLEDLL